MEEPSKHIMAGVELVTIPVTEYAELLDCRRQLAELRLVQRGFEKPSRSPIERDPEVAVFIAERIGRTTLRAIRDECMRSFGAPRTPSPTAVCEYAKRVRRRSWPSAVPSGPR